MATIRPSEAHGNNSTKLLLWALATLGLYLLTIASLDQLRPLDQIMFHWVQEQRNCYVDWVARLVGQSTTSPIGTGIAVFATVAWLSYQRRWHDLVTMTLIIGGAALLNEWFKYFVLRPRPNALSMVEVGRSFPSGHATSAVTILGCIYHFVLARMMDSRWQRRVALLVVLALIAAIGYQRLYLTHRWLSDVVGGFLLGGAWFFFNRSSVEPRLTAKSLSGLALAFAASFATLWLMPNLRMTVAPPLQPQSMSVTKLDIASQSSDAVQSRFGRIVSAGPRQQLWRFLKPETKIPMTLEQGANYRLRFTARPELTSNRAQCRTIKIAVGGQILKTVILSDSWRDYEVALAPKSATDAQGLLTIRFEPTHTGSLFVANPELHKLATTSD